MPPRLQPAVIEKHPWRVFPALASSHFPVQNKVRLSLGAQTAGLVFYPTAKLCPPVCYTASAADSCASPPPCSGIGCSCPLVGHRETNSGSCADLHGPPFSRPFSLRPVGAGALLSSPPAGCAAGGANNAAAARFVQRYKVAGAERAGAAKSRIPWMHGGGGCLPLPNIQGNRGLTCAPAPRFRQSPEVPQLARSQAAIAVVPHGGPWYGRVSGRGGGRSGNLSSQPLSHFHGDLRVDVDDAVRSLVAVATVAGGD